MLKFFRKYRGWILAVGGSLLMVVFLLGGIIGQMGSIGPSPVFATITINGEIRKLRGREAAEAGLDMQVMESAFGNALGMVVDPLGETGESKPLADSTHWLLLKLEAEDAGLIGGVGDARNWLQSQAAMYAEFNPAFNGDIDRAYFELLANMKAGQYGERRVLEAIAGYLGVQRLVNSYFRAPLASDYRMHALAEKFNESVTVKFVFVDAASFIAELPDPSESEQQAHFERYKDVEPGTGQFGIGYRQPDRAKVEYIQIDYQSVLDQIPEDGLEARLWYDRNKQDLPLPPGATEPQPYEEVMDQAMGAYRREKAEELANEIISSAKAKLLRSTRGLERDGEYRVVPDEWGEKRVSFVKLMTQIEDEFDVDVEYDSFDGRWINMEDVGDLGPLRQANRTVGTRNVGIIELLQSTREFGDPTVPGLQAGIADIEPMRRLEAAREFMDRRNPMKPTDIFFYRVVAVDPARPADSLDEVRDEVIRDMKRLQAYETLKAEQDTWQARGINEGLDTLAEELDTTVRNASVRRYDRFGFTTGEGFVPTNISDLGRNEKLASKIFERAEALDVIGSTETLPDEECTVSAAIDDKLGLAIARINRIRPMDKEAMQLLVTNGLTIRAPDSPTSNQRLGFLDILNRYELEQDFSNPFSYEAMRERLNFVSERPAPAEDDGDAGSMSGAAESDEAAATDSGTEGGEASTDGG